MLSAMITSTTGFVLEAFQMVTSEVRHSGYETIPPPVSPLKKVTRPTISDDYLVDQICWLIQDKKWSTLVREIQDSLKKGSVNTVERADEMLKAIEAAKEAHKNVSALLFSKDGLNTMNDLHCQINTERTRLTSGLSSATIATILESKAIRKH